MGVCQGIEYPLTKSTHPSTTTAFVHQKELLYGYLTPREHLTFHAFTRMSREYSREALLARVEEVRAYLHVCLAYE